MTKELYPIPGHEDYYVTKTGKVFKDNWNNTEDLRELKYSIVKNYNKTKSYRSVWIQEGDKRKIYRVGRLMLMTFVGDSPLYVHHKDGDSLNDNLDNLCYATKNGIQQNRAYHFEVFDLDSKTKYDLIGARLVAEVIGVTHTFVLRHCVDSAFKHNNFYIRRVY